jgi:hypothetical protein
MSKLYQNIRKTSNMGYGDFMGNRAKATKLAQKQCGSANELIQILVDIE